MIGHNLALQKRETPLKVRYCHMVKEFQLILPCKKILDPNSKSGSRGFLPDLWRDAGGNSCMLLKKEVMNAIKVSFHRFSRPPL